MKTMKLKNYRSRKKIILSVLLFLLFFLTFILFKLFNNVTLYIMNYAEAEVRKLASLVINNSLSNDKFQILKFEDMYHITRNNDDEIEMVDYDSVVVNEFLNNVTVIIQENLLKLEKGEINISKDVDSSSGILFYIPLGVVTNNIIFNTMGPNIPVKMKAINAILTNINTSVTEYGINNSLITMNIYLEIKIRIILPFISKDILISNEIPVAYKLINGRIPSYYGTNGLNKSSNIYTIPLE